MIKVYYNFEYTADCKERELIGECKNYYEALILIGKYMIEVAQADYEDLLPPTECEMYATVEYPNGEIVRVNL